jgi:AraC family transcriptional regulator
MNQALAYIEANLADEIDFKQVERLALCSDYHFRRMFSFLAGVTLSDYIRRRRLTLAALDLVQQDTRVIDTALKYGYTSPDAFARAFHMLHGVNPAEAKSSGKLLKAYPRMTFQLTIRGGTAMNYRLEEKAAFRMVGIMKRVKLIYTGINPEIAAMWESMNQATVQTLEQLSNVEPRGLINASTNFSEGRLNEGELDHYIGVATTQEAPAHLAQLEVPAGTWAVFEAVGPFPDTLQNIWGRIYAEWFPGSGYELGEGPEILWVEDEEYTLPSFRCELWIPIQRGQLTSA